jgi:mRNA-degrading endonuclease RelE of RelBE toxin-antitoxin system
MYELRFHPKVDKELGKFFTEIRKVIRYKYFPDIANDPRKSGKPLKGTLKGFWSKDFIYEGVSYRIAYEIDDKENVVYVLMIGKRESFYERLKRRANI